VLDKRLPAPNRNESRSSNPQSIVEGALPVAGGRPLTLENSRMIRTPTSIRDFERVVDAYGYWPSFPDSPVLRFRQDNDSIELEVEAWEMTSETDDESYYKLIRK